MFEHHREHRNEVALALVGSGGAGVMTTGELLLCAAAACGLYGMLTKSYGPQIRGGESACLLRLGSKPFDKQADELDLLIALDWRNIDRFHEELRLNPEAWILFEESQGQPPANWQARSPYYLSIAWRDLASKVGGGKGHPNLFMLGMLCFLLGFTKTAALEAVIERFGIRGAGLEEETQVASTGLVQAGWRWGEQKWMVPPFAVSAEHRTPTPWVLTGNQAIVLGTLEAGCEFYAGYPITPATDIMQELSEYLPQRQGVVIQAEDELAAIAMATGASFAGKKAMVGTSGPGFSLMAEGLGLAVMAEIPLVVVNVQRGGPSTGTPTRTEQSDLWAALGSSHGDNPRIVLAPSTVPGCMDTMVKAFNLAERYQVPVIVLSDQFLAGRKEIVEPVPLGALPMETRRVAEAAVAGPFGRFNASPQQPVAPIPIPGIPGTEYVADGLEHDERGWPDTSPAMHQQQADRRMKKLAPLETEEGWIETCGDPDAPVGLIGWGSTGGVIRETVRLAQQRRLRIKGLIPHLLYPPQPILLNRCFTGLDILYIAELTSLGQFHRYLRAWCDLPPRVVPIARAGGMPFRTAEVLSAIEASAPFAPAGSQVEAHQPTR